MYNIIRLGSGYDPVIVVTPYGAGPTTEGVKCFLKASWDTGYGVRDEWHEITPDQAEGYISGQADGMGFEAVPTNDFESLAAVDEWVESHREHFTEE
jgi:hypothetical protein